MLGPQAQASNSGPSHPMLKRLPAKTLNTRMNMSNFTLSLPVLLDSHALNSDIQTRGSMQTRSNARNLLAPSTYPTPFYAQENLSNR